MFGFAYFFDCTTVYVGRASDHPKSKIGVVIETRSGLSLVGTIVVELVRNFSVFISVSPRVFLSYV